VVYGCLGSGIVEIFHSTYLDATSFDETQDYYPSNSVLGIGAGPSWHTITRSFEITPGAGTHTIAVTASAAAGPTISIGAASPPFIPQAQMVIQLVNN
jgi:hypothetical protein